VDPKGFRIPLGSYPEIQTTPRSLTPAPVEIILAL
jgi:hypothetical protein